MDNKEILRCPACGKDMKKIFIPSSDINVDICIDGCGGIYFDNRELEKFDEPVENAEDILNAIKGKTFEIVDETQTRVCPVCKTPMVKNGVAGTSVKIDVCNVCGAKFLDNGELEKIRNAETVDKDDEMEVKSELLYKENYKNVVRRTPILDSLGFGGSAKRTEFFQNLIYKNL